MAILSPQDLYHTGIVVEDLDRSLARLGEVGGYRWTAPLEYPFSVWSPTGGRRDVDFRCAYSVDAPHLELVQQVPGTVWTPGPTGSVHHIGYFVDDLAAASAALDDAGVALEACGQVDGTRPAVFAYHKGPDGIRIEVVQRGVFGDFEAFVRQAAADGGR